MCLNLSVPINQVLHLLFLFKYLIVCLHAHLNYYLQSSVYAPRIGIDPTRGGNRPRNRISLPRGPSSAQSPENAAPRWNILHSEANANPTL